MWLTILVNYWYVPAIVLLWIVFALLRKAAESKAKDAIVAYLAKAEQTIFANADLGIAQASEAVYSVLPVSVKAFLPKVAFQFIVQEAYHEAKALTTQQAPQAPADAPKQQ